MFFVLCFVLRPRVGRCFAFSLFEDSMPGRVSTVARADTKVGQMVTTGREWGGGLHADLIWRGEQCGELTRGDS